MEKLWTFKQPYNVNVAASVAGLASLRHVDQIYDVVEKLKTERDRLFAALQTIPYLRPDPVPGQLHPLPGGRPPGRRA